MLNRRAFFLAGSGTLAGLTLSPSVFAAVPAFATREVTPTAEKPILLNFNENSLGLAKSAQDAIQKQISTAFRYPDAVRSKLIADIGAHYGLKAENVTLGNGSSETIQAALEAQFHKAAEAGQKVQVIAPDPTFGVAQAYTEAAGVPYVPVPLVEKTLQADVAALKVSRSCTSAIRTIRRAWFRPRPSSTPGSKRRLRRRRTSSSSSTKLTANMRTTRSSSPGSSSSRRGSTTSSFLAPSRSSTPLPVCAWATASARLRPRRRSTPSPRSTTRTQWVRPPRARRSPTRPILRSRSKRRNSRRRSSPTPSTNLESNTFRPRRTSSSTRRRRASTTRPRWRKPTSWWAAPSRPTTTGTASRSGPRAK